MKKRSVVNMAPGAVFTTFFSLHIMNGSSKLEWLSLSSLSSEVLCNTTAYWTHLLATKKWSIVSTTIDEYWHKLYKKSFIVFSFLVWYIWLKLFWTLWNGLAFWRSVAMVSCFIDNKYEKAVSLVISLREKCIKNNERTNKKILALML